MRRETTYYVASIELPVRIHQNMDDGGTVYVEAAELPRASIFKLTPRLGFPDLGLTSNVEYDRADTALTEEETLIWNDLTARILNRVLDKFPEQRRLECKSM